jgi:hypothetical protein
MFNKRGAKYTLEHILSLVLAVVFIVVILLAAAPYAFPNCDFKSNEAYKEFVSKFEECSRQTERCDCGSFSFEEMRSNHKIVLNQLENGVSTGLSCGGGRLVDKKLFKDISLCTYNAEFNDAKDIKKVSLFLDRREITSSEFKGIITLFGNDQKSVSLMHEESNVCLPILSEVRTRGRGADTTLNYEREGLYHERVGSCSSAAGGS